MFMYYKFRALLKFKCPILKYIIGSCIVRNLLNGVLFCNNENKMYMYMYDVSREKKMCTIYLYIFIRQKIHNDFFSFLIFNEEGGKETRQNVNIHKSLQIILNVSDWLHFNIPSYINIFFALFLISCFHFFSRKYTSKCAWKLFMSI